MLYQLWFEFTGKENWDFFIPVKKKNPRRFQSMMAFNMPGMDERHALWEQSFSKKLPLDPVIDLWNIAEKYEISGGVMINVVRKATLRAVTRQQKTISQKELEMAIHQELQKEGIILN